MLRFQALVLTLVLTLSNITLSMSLYPITLSLHFISDLRASDSLSRGTQYR